MKQIISEFTLLVFLIGLISCAKIGSKSIAENAEIPTPTVKEEITLLGSCKVKVQGLYDYCNEVRVNEVFPNFALQLPAQREVCKKQGAGFVFHDGQECEHVAPIGKCLTENVIQNKLFSTNTIYFYSEYSPGTSKASCSLLTGGTIKSTWFDPSQ